MFECGKIRNSILNMEKECKIKPHGKGVHYKGAAKNPEKVYKEIGKVSVG